MDRLRRAWWAFSLVGALAIIFSSIDGQAQAPTTFEQPFQPGTPVTVTGELTVMYADDFENKRSELIHTIVDERTGKSLRIRFEGEPPRDLRSGARVRIRGHASDSELYAYAAQADSSSTGTTSSVEIISQPATAATTGHSTLVMIANFRDANVSCSADTIRDTVFTNPNRQSVADLYRACSLGQVSLSGDVVGPFTIDFASTDACDPSGWLRATNDQAAANGVNVSAYVHRIYVMPRNTCPAAGYAGIGGGSALIFGCDLPGLYAHELGHNLGMDHASTYASEYGDLTDPMGLSEILLKGVNAPHRHQLGWLGVNRLQLVSQSGMYILAPLALDPAVATAPQTILIMKRDTGEYYYLSYRAALGFDNYGQIDGWYVNRLSVHAYKGDGSASRTFLLAGLADGERYADSANGITVTLMGHDPMQATVSVDFTSTCVSTPPSMSIMPQAQSGSAGTTVSYSVSLTNADTPACPASNFSLSDVVPVGWGATLSALSLTLAPGATGQATLSLTSGSGASGGAYGATVNVTDAAATAHTAAVPLTYTVVVPDTVPPTPPYGLTPTVSQRLKRIQLSWGAATDNIGVAGYRIWRNGVVVGASTDMSWTDSEYISGATYTYLVTAYDGAGNVSPPSNDATVTLSSGKKK
jgi:Gametolysin peptidase M11/NPCBM-associated, NEW3 domain of alpha-galactosidase